MIDDAILGTFGLSNELKRHLSIELNASELKARRSEVTSEQLHERYCEQRKRASELLEEQRNAYTKEADAEEQQIIKEGKTCEFQLQEKYKIVQSDNDAAIELIESMQTEVMEKPVS